MESTETSQEPHIEEICERYKALYAGAVYDVLDELGYPDRVLCHHITALSPTYCELLWKGQARKVNQRRVHRGPRGCVFPNRAKSRWLLPFQGGQLGLDAVGALVALFEGRSAIAEPAILYLEEFAGLDREGAIFKARFVLGHVYERLAARVDQARTQ